MLSNHDLNIWLFHHYIMYLCLYLYLPSCNSLRWIVSLYLRRGVESPAEQLGQGQLPLESSEEATEGSYVAGHWPPDVKDIFTAYIYITLYHISCGRTFLLSKRGPDLKRHPMIYVASFNLKDESNIVHTAEVAQIKLDILQKWERLKYFTPELVFDCFLPLMTFYVHLNYFW